METITLKSNSPEVILELLKKAVERERKIIIETIRITKEKVDSLAKKLGVDIDKLMKGEIEHTEDNDMQLIELEGEIELLRHLESELKALESVEICK
ncbi:hypothetical protein [Thermodesulfovibrio yellowstonii]|uniref:Uncharacterized protein n=1 Tax=Thermodesulfovibrio yellowstonii TaxID=28262 RepID=A0A9W6GFK3_9BACT|nr:hypothetical protein [Thermodesulfovibrio islandicus]GLI52941.1 hypothetical protein TISLANDTSLP1_06340 [Thermodesulfovibrio islandicus]